MWELPLSQTGKGVEMPRYDWRTCDNCKIERETTESVCSTVENVIKEFDDLFTALDSFKNGTIRVVLYDSLYVPNDVKGRLF